MSFYILLIWFLTWILADSGVLKTFKLLLSDYALFCHCFCHLAVFLLKF